MASARHQNSKRQQTFSFSTWGGKRKNAGRKPKGARAGVPHRPRPALASRHPVHVTLRVVAGLPNLRSKACIRTIEQTFVRTSQRPGFRLVHYSVQRNHLHLLCEAKNAASLSSGLRGLSISLARRLNRRLGRKGALLADRYHSRILRTPREVRAVLAYLLGNARRHAWQRRQSFERRWLDPCSSGPAFSMAGGISKQLPCRTPRRWRRPAPGWCRPAGDGWGCSRRTLSPGLRPRPLLASRWQISIRAGSGKKAD